MRLENYEFGRLRVDGRDYSQDLIVYPDRVHAPWWRQTGHRLLPEDLADVLTARPRVLVVGTGAHGRMAVPQPTRMVLDEAGIELRAAPTAEAVALFNQLEGKGDHPVGAFHLTC